MAWGALTNNKLTWFTLQAHLVCLDAPWFTSQAHLVYLLLAGLRKRRTAALSNWDATHTWHMWLALLVCTSSWQALFGLHTC